MTLEDIPAIDPLMGFKMEDVEEELIVEGYLKKIRGLFRNRIRWFRLTKNHIAFYEKDGGKMISSVRRIDIADIADVSARRFRITTSVVFGASGQSTMLLEARSPAVKENWMRYLKTAGCAPRPQVGSVKCEGYLVKLQGFGSMNRTRWFVLSDTNLAYYREEGGDLMGICAVSDIDSIVEVGDGSFKITASKPFTKTGASSVLCECESGQVCEKWTELLKRTLPRETVKSAFSPLPSQDRKETDHFGVATKAPGGKEELGDSEGNRFIRSHDL